MHEETSYQAAKAYPFEKHNTLFGFNTKTAKPVVISSSIFFHYFSSVLTVKTESIFTVLLNSVLIFGIKTVQKITYVY